jgi:hypothetical protein
VTPWKAEILAINQCVVYILAGVTLRSRSTRLEPGQQYVPALVLFADLIVGRHAKRPDFRLLCSFGFVSLILEKFSLFRGVGNLADSIPDSSKLGPIDTCELGENLKIPCSFPVYQGNRPETGSLWTTSSTIKSLFLIAFRPAPAFCRHFRDLAGG